MISMEELVIKTNWNIMSIYSASCSGKYEACMSGRKFTMKLQNFVISSNLTSFDIFLFFWLFGHNKSKISKFLCLLLVRTNKSKSSHIKSNLSELCRITRKVTKQKVSDSFWYSPNHTEVRAPSFHHRSMCCGPLWTKK